MAMVMRRAFGSLGGIIKPPTTTPKCAQSRQRVTKYLIGHAARVSFTTTSSTDPSFIYRIEVSNASRPDATKITVRGPDVDGIMASMTVALARQGCSLLELHAGYCPSEYKAADSPAYELHLDNNQIEDVFYVAQHGSGEPIPDESLQDLGQSMLEALRNPMNVISRTADKNDTTNAVQHPSQETQITVIQSNQAK